MITQPSKVHCIKMAKDIITGQQCALHGDSNGCSLWRSPDSRCRLPTPLPLLDHCAQFFLASIVTLFVPAYQTDVRMCRTINKGQRSCPKRHGWPDHCKYAKNLGVSINASYFGTERRLGFGIKKLHLSKESPCLVVRQYTFFVEEK